MWGQPEPGDAGHERRAQVRLHGVRALVALALAIATYLLFPAAPAIESPLYEVGSVAPENVIAPFGFRVAKTNVELATEREASVRATAPVFAVRAAVVDTVRARARRFFDAVAEGLATPGGAGEAQTEAAATAAALRLSPDELTYLRVPAQRAAMADAVVRAFERHLPRGVAPNGALTEVRGEVAVLRDGRLTLVPADSVITYGALVALARAQHPDPRSAVADGLYVKLLGAFFEPTLVPDGPATERRRAEAAAAVDGNKWLVRTGEKIVGAHEVVGREQYEKLRALRDALHARGVEERSPLATWGRVLGSVLLNALLVALLFVALLLFRPALYRNLRVVALFALAFLLIIGTAALVGRMPEPRAELVPVALAAVLFSILFDPRISLVAVMVLAVLVGAQGPFSGTNALFVLLIGGVAAAMSVQTVRRRNQAYLSMLVVAGGYLLAAVALGLTLGWGWREMAMSAGVGAVGAVASIALAMGLLPWAEDFTGIDTYLRLLEWSDLNRPIMQRLALEAPGTYAHTIAMANLVETACNAIGANGLLGRVGTYYHDIGKLERPLYFVENQPKGRNPHDKLKPSASAAIIRNHVREGLALAEEHKLPKAVRAFINEHHGTGRIAYFYEKAKERGDATSPNAAEYAYPGPNPQSAETAVCMLADGVEAAARAMQDPTPQRLRELVEHIVRQRIEQGQLRDAPLTLRQLEILKEQFVRTLLGMYHNRIDYPAAAGGTPTTTLAAVPVAPTVASAAGAATPAQGILPAGRASA
ncbi:MAG TPA: HDIG domain-containing protein [Gemmatirosa sp.]|nr:HDIG domain-containing protein [Gemmatirosa sp.]